MAFIFLLASAGVLILLLVHSHVKDPLRAFSGPFSARLTNLWRLIFMYRGELLHKSRKLHDALGCAVRIGPNYISLSDVNLIKTIYANDERYRKGEFYTVGDIPGRPPIANIFSEKDSLKHQRLIRPVLKLYSANKVDQFEPLLNSAIESFINVVHGKILRTQSKSWRCDQERWIEYFTWDAMSTMTFSKPLGFLTQQTDVGNLLSISQMSVTYMSVVGCMPFLDNFLDKNPIHRIGPPAFSHAAAFSFEQIAKRSHTTKPAFAEDNGQKDFLDHFLALRHSPDHQVNDSMLLIYMFANVVAGSDTVACALNAILRYTLTTPSAYRKLQDELLPLPFEAIVYKELKKLPYLSAVIREAMRLCPSIGMHLERVVPPEGLHLSDGRFIPSGTLVAMNAGVLHRQSVFGENVDAFVPERWLPRESEGEEEAKERIKAMKAANFVFGYGKRACLGKELALMEIYVFVTRLVREFKMEIVNAERPWKVLNRFFVYPSGTEIAFKARTAQGGRHPDESLWVGCLSEK